MLFVQFFEEDVVHLVDEPTKLGVVDEVGINEIDDDYDDDEDKVCSLTRF